MSAGCISLNLSRKERRAMRLTQHVISDDLLRRPDLDGTGYGDDVLASGPDWLYYAAYVARMQLMRRDWQTANRLLRARLALAIRVLLRAEREDYGPVEWHGCRCQCDGEAGGWQPRRYTAAWESAPAWDASVTPAMRRQEAAP